ncbi:MAG TPA: sigma-70 family RNA polymerase sigma factor [Vicinamibacterales bacterium]|jgi:RNA polymerase sigma-70 factor (ECF subfamily)
MDLASLIERCREGDDLAWEAFVRHFQRRVYSIASGYAANPDEAQDLAQDIFIRVYETRGRWAATDIFLPWLVRVARNVCIDALRRKKARPPAEDVLADEMLDLSAPGGTPESELAATNERRLIWKAMRSLGELSREMILLKEIQGQSLQEIAAALHVPVGTVKSRSNRARLELAARVLELQGSGVGR